ncbi:hypothetical protein P4S72_15175 [Vibrio sp. PP-XX7]
MKLPGRFTPDNFTFDFLDCTTSTPSPCATAFCSHRGPGEPPGIPWSLWAPPSILSGVLGLLVGYAVPQFIPLGGRAFTSDYSPPLLGAGHCLRRGLFILFLPCRGPIPALYGTPAILIIALIAEKMPFASRSGIAAMTQLGRGPEEAARGCRCRMVYPV